MRLARRAGERASERIRSARLVFYVFLFLPSARTHTPARVTHALNIAHMHGTPIAPLHTDYLQQQARGSQQTDF
jgi:hypothetical protein